MRFIQLSAECIINTEDIVAVLDMDRATVEKELRIRLSRAEKAGKLINSAPKLPKSLIFMRNGSIYISPLMAQTVKKRCM